LALEEEGYKTYEGHEFSTNGSGPSA
jgi:hypothetical protein